MDEVVFANDPARFFDRDSHAAHRMDRATMERLQLDAIRHRFASLKDRLKALGILSRETGVYEISSLSGALPLFFPHAVYKSYPEEFLLQGRFDLMTDWLQAFTACDVSVVRGGGQETIDGWLDDLDSHTKLRVCHSSGTTGRLSFFPRGAEDFEASKNILRMNLSQWVDDPASKLWDYEFTVIHLAPRRGRAGIARSVKHIESMLVPPGVLHVLDDSEQSVDVQHFVSRTRAAIAQGTPVGIEPTAYISAQMEAAHQRSESQAGGFQRIHDLLTGPLAGQYAMVIGGTPMVHALAKAGLELGGRNVLGAGGGHLMTAGGLKGLALGDDWQDVLRSYFGNTSVNQAYGMTEIMGGFAMCKAGDYHCPPWIVPFVLDAETGRPLPREGAQSGRGAFFDLSARTYWGGIVSADRVTISWAPCSCGRTTPHMDAGVTRSFDGSDDGLTAAAPKEAIDAVVEGCAKAWSLS